MDTVLVTGATGNVGSKVALGMHARGARVRAFVRDPERAAGLLGHGVELTRGDFGEPDSLRRALDGVDRVFLACSNQPRQVELECAAIDAAAAAGVRLIVKLSAPEGAEVGSPLDFWDWQARIERHLTASGVPAAVLKPSGFMSNVLASADAIRSTGKLFAPMAGARVALVDPADVAAAAVVALGGEGHAGKRYVLTGPEALSWEQIAAHLSAATSRTIEFVDVPDEAAHAQLLAAGMPEWLARNIIVMAGLMRAGAVARTTDAVQTLTGRAPRSFDEWARENAAAFGA